VEFVSVVGKVVDVEFVVRGVVEVDVLVPLHAAVINKNTMKTTPAVKKIPLSIIFLFI
jgi:hypothetical protein